MDFHVGALAVSAGNKICSGDPWGSTIDTGFGFQVVGIGLAVLRVFVF